MKYMCADCKRTFIHPAIYEATTPVLGEVGQVAKIAKHSCPYCNSINLGEFVELEPEIVSVKSVDFENVDALIKEGYQVHEIYAKQVVLIKKEVK